MTSSEKQNCENHVRTLEDLLKLNFTESEFKKVLIFVDFILAEGKVKGMEEMMKNRYS